jgi:hypothetical protein
MMPADRARRARRAQYLTLALAIPVFFAGTAEAQEAPAPRWLLTLGAYQGYESNARLTVFEPQTNVTTHARLLAAHQSTSPRGSLSAAFGAGGLLYSRIEDLRRFNFSLSASGRYRVSSRTSLSASERSSLDYTTRLDEDLDDPDVLLTLARVFRNRSTVRLDRVLTQQTGLSASFSHDMARYLDAEPLIDGSRWGPTLSIGRRFAQSRLQFSTAFQRNQRAGATVDSFAFGAEWSKQLRPRLGVNLGAGAMQLWGEGSSSFAPTAQAGLTLALQRGSLSAGYARARRQAFGLGRERTVDAFTLNYTQVLSRRVEALLSGTWAISRDEVTAGSETLQGVRGGLAIELARETRLGLSYRLRRRHRAPGPHAIAHSVEAGLSHTFRWR